MKIRYLLSVAALTVLAGIASAGYIQPAAVFVDLDTMSAVGDQWTARTSKNDVEFIGCGVRVFSDGYSWGFCQANNSEDVGVTCITDNVYLLEAIKGISDFSVIIFEWQDDGGGGAECTYIGFSTQSFYLPNFTTKGKK